jgi:hypothetical protein
MRKEIRTQKLLSLLVALLLATGYAYSQGSADSRGFSVIGVGDIMLGSHFPSQSIFLLTIMLTFY